MIRFFWKTIKQIFTFCIILYATTNSSFIYTANNYRHTPIIRQYEFDFLGWSGHAILDKVSAFSINTNNQLNSDQKNGVVIDYLHLIRQVSEAENQMELYLSNPEFTGFDNEKEKMLGEVSNYRDRLAEIQPLAEQILQDQITETIQELGISRFFIFFPPLLFKTTPLPEQLIISPRDQIRQDASISLSPNILIEEINQIERLMESEFDISALIVPLGGIGTYPSMVIRTDDLEYLIETAAHEWVHNYLAFYPLGLNYSSSPELQTINETVASIAGVEISRKLIQMFFGDLLNGQHKNNFQINYFKNDMPQLSPDEQFDFRFEMYQTRKQVDQYLAKGLIHLAEEYMENRRKYFWDNEYYIRRLNQAYFAFYGAYSDEPYSAAGVDPVGAAVRDLRARSTSLADFLHTIRWISSIHDLKIKSYSY